MSTKSVNILKKISNEAWKQSNYYKLEKSLLFKILTGFKSFYIFLTLAQSLMVLIERISIIYLPQTIRLGIFLSYCRGYCDRKRINLKNMLGINKNTFKNKKILIVGGTGSFGNQFLKNLLIIK